MLQCESKKSPLRFSDIFSQTLENFTSIFYTPNICSYIRKNKNIKRDYLVHIIGRNARIQTFAKVVDSFVDRCLWQVIPDLLLL